MRPQTPQTQPPHQNPPTQKTKVLENGISEKGEASRSGEAKLKDDLRTRYFRGYIDEACK